MNFIFWVIVGGIIALLLVIVFGIAKASGLSEYRTALMQCQKCRFFISGDPQIREIFCKKHGAIVVELVEKCKKFKEN